MDKQNKKIPHPLYDYEKVVIDAIELVENNHRDRHVWVKKATGLGITELILRYMVWLALRDNVLDQREMFIVTGPREDLAVGLISRIKEMIGADIIDETHKKVAYIEGCKIEAYPSHHVSTMRGMNPAVVFVDEGDFFPKGQQLEVKAVAERYIAKTAPILIFVSTPNEPGGLFESMEKEPDLTTIYRRIFLPYTVGVGKIYTEDDIRDAMKSRSFEREYNLQYGFGIGNMFPAEALEAITEEYSWEMSDGEKVLCVDPGYSNKEGSQFAIVGAEMLDSIIYIKDCEQYPRASPESMVAKIVEIFKNRKYHICLVDAAWPGTVRDLEQGSDILHRQPINVETVSFRETLDMMSQMVPTRVKEKKVRIHIHNCKDLLAQLRAVVSNQKGHPDKHKLTFDLGDAFLMAVAYYGEGNIEFDAI